MMAVTAFQTSGGQTYIGTDQQDDTIAIYQESGRTAVDVFNGSAGFQRYLFSNVSLLVVNTLGGNDKIYNNTNIPSVIQGGDGIDFISGGGTADTLYGGNQDDSIYGNGGGDTLYGDDGRDKVYGGVGDDKLQGDNWTINGDLNAIRRAAYGANDDYLDGGAGIDYVAGQFGNDTLLGGAGNDTVLGGSGSDTMNGDDVEQRYYIAADKEFAGDDNLYGETGHDKIWGGWGNDFISGSDGHDEIRGGFGNDALYGDANNDKLFGGDGNDRLFGGADNDFIQGGDGDDWYDGGTWFETAYQSIGEGGNDYNAYITTVNGTKYNDIEQGQIGNCFLLAPISAVVARGTDLSSRITYLGNGEYGVTLYSKSSTGVVSLNTVRVTFNGVVQSGDATPQRNGQEGESWALIMNRALASHLGVSLQFTTGGIPDKAMFALTGRTVTSLVAPQDAAKNYSPLADFVLDSIVNGLNAGKAIVGGTQPNASQMTSSMLSQSHAYAVLAIIPTAYRYDFLTGRLVVTNCNLVLYNPWGRDTSAAPNNATTVSGIEDGIVEVTWGIFRTSFNQVHIS